MSVVGLSGRHRLSLIREIATSEMSFAEIAARREVDEADVLAFAKKYADDIAEVKRATTGAMSLEVAGLWVTKRENRLAEMQRDLELLERKIRDMLRTGQDEPRDLALLVRSRLDAMRAAASELSHTTASDDADRTAYVIEVEGFAEDLT
jgi:hypothetical protein